MMPIILGILITSCGQEGKNSSVNIEFAKKTTGLNLEGVDKWVTPSVLSLTPIAVRIGKSNNGGYMIWGNTDCPGSEGEEEVDDKTYKYFSEHECNTSEGNRSIDLLAGIDEVNAILNSQSWPVPPGTYTHVSMIMCGPNESDGVNQAASSNVNNWEYQAGSMTESRAVRFCSPFGTEMTTPVEVSEGGSLTIEVAYDSNQMINHYDATDSPFPCANQLNDYATNIVDPDDSSSCLGFYDPKIGGSEISASIK